MGKREKPPSPIGKRTDPILWVRKKSLSFRRKGWCLKKRDKLNCWEFKKCGRIPGGRLNDFAGICPAFFEKKLNGIHGGYNAGRACWVVAGTMCEGKIQGTFASKFKGCGLCDFFKTIRQDEDRNLLTSSDLLEMLADKTILSQK